MPKVKSKKQPKPTPEPAKPPPVRRRYREPPPDKSPEGYARAEREYNETLAHKKMLQRAQVPQDLLDQFLNPESEHYDPSQIQKIEKHRHDSISRDDAVMEWLKCEYPRS